uniref:Uncharacterized protein n=1 Tax=Leersia perrieri TaxID=77586 RepID=A0A0D9XZT8_9ORYZ
MVVIDLFVNAAMPTDWRYRRSHATNAGQEADNNEQAVEFACTDPAFILKQPWDWYNMSSRWSPPRLAACPSPMCTCERWTTSSSGSMRLLVSVRLLAKLSFTYFSIRKGGKLSFRKGKKETRSELTTRHISLNCNRWAALKKGQRA